MLEKRRGRSAFVYRLWREDTGRTLLPVRSQVADLSEWENLSKTTQPPRMGGERFLSLTRRSAEYRAIWMRHPAPDGPVSVLLATSSRPVRHEMGEFLRLLLILGGTVLLIAGVLTAISVRLTLRPIRQTASRLQEVTYQNPRPGSLGDVRPPRELLPFVDSIRSMLERLSAGIESQKRFIANASHELRTPLALAKSTLQAARLKKRTPAEYEKALDELLEDVDRLNHLAEQVLDLARLEEPPGPQTRQPVRLVPILRALVAQYDRRVADAGGRVILAADADPTVFSSEGELSSLFANLIDNAAKHGPPGGTVRIQVEANGAAECRVQVHDEGGGIPPDQIDRLTERFYRTDDSRSSRTGGAGLGLAIAHEVASRCGGRIRITSSLEAGTTAIVTLPAGR